jgi:two-component system nitrate/nitrite response regulator NarL
VSGRCLIADDHPALVAAVEIFLTEGGYTVVGIARDGERALALAEAEQPELAIVDYRMPGLSGLELISRLKSTAPGVRIVVYTADADDTIAREVMAHGADGIVLKEAPLHDLTRALEAVASGRSYIDPALAAGALGAGGRSRAPLTERERAVLARLSSGRSHADIGSELGIGVETVRTHLRKASEKLDASTRTQAVATALRLGLID